MTREVGKRLAAGFVLVSALTATTGVVAIRQGGEVGGLPRTVPVG
jgi:hypothetical protein